MTRKQLESSVEESRLKLTGAGAHREPVTNATELVWQDLLSARELLTAVESRQRDMDRLHQTSVVLADTASEARQKALQSELAVLTDADAELTEMLMLRITRLEKVHRSWTELTTQCNELRTLLTEKKETLQQTVLDTALIPDQQYAVIKVRVFFW